MKKLILTAAGLGAVGLLGAAVVARALAKQVLADPTADPKDKVSPAVDDILSDPVGHLVNTINSIVDNGKLFAAAVITDVDEGATEQK